MMAHYGLQNVRKLSNIKNNKSFKYRSQIKIFWEELMKTLMERCFLRFKQPFF